MDERASRRPFAALLLSVTGANLGDGIMITAGALLAATLTRDPVLVAGVVTAQRLPWFLLTLVAGVIVDRADRRLLMMAGNGARAVALAALAVTVATDTASLPLLYAVAFVLGAAETVIDNASLALMPAIVPRQRYNQANGRIASAQSLFNELIGPPIGSVLFAVAAVAAFATGSVAFVLGAIVLLAVPRQPRPAAAPARFIASLGEGLRVYWSTPLLPLMSAMAGVSNLCFSAATGIMVLVAQDRLGIDGAGFGVLIAAGSVGGVLGGLCGPWFVRRIGEGPTIFIANLTPAIGFAAFVVTDSPVIAGAALALWSFAAMTGNVVVMTFRQSSVPDHLLGRVTSAYRLVAMGALPLGAIVGGALASWFGLTAPFVFGAVAMAVMAFALLPVMTTRRLRAVMTGKHRDEEDVAG
ncbi:putative MFS family arabinose efflux permease [Diaminobutyricimonas aerilata]|uniref:Putative MFS family arabinose efflux permease n=1 Tax=Diaminobutyricimonas aerilata TaxID=1162967 RepID=A0A2M9CNV8_9MICO|nr:MFS transporter [Diaminobutyricimonas aerilata]PJJ73590.1 putative MFS family arabinose efflux permease [Diaminobutyricimonas aerilata]